MERLDPRPDYLVLVNRAWQRGVEMAYQVFPVAVTESLPCIPVPLDLRYVFGRTYDGGPYRRGAVNYGQPPAPPLPGELAAWAEQRVREQGTRESSTR